VFYFFLFYKPFIRKTFTFALLGDLVPNMDLKAYACSDVPFVNPQPIDDELTLYR